MENDDFIQKPARQYVNGKRNSCDADHVKVRISINSRFDEKIVDEVSPLQIQCRDENNPVFECCRSIRYRAITQPNYRAFGRIMEGAAGE
jgi:hypothetical protein